MLSIFLNFHQVTIFFNIFHFLFIVVSYIFTIDKRSYIITNWRKPSGWILTKDLIYTYIAFRRVMHLRAQTDLGNFVNTNMTNGLIN
jgi:hypothetical protein